MTKVHASCRFGLPPARCLADLAQATLRLACGEGEIPRIERLCFADRWVVAQLSDGHAGRAFLFNGEHAVYGALEFSHMEACKGLVGWSVGDALAWALSCKGDALDGGGLVRVPTAPVGLESMAPGDPAAPAFSSLKSSLALALINALSFGLNAPLALRARGFEILPEDDRSFLQDGDHVVLIGAGMLLRESAESCTRVDVIDMRPRASLQSIAVDAEGVHLGPPNVSFHGVEDAERLVADADVVGVTGCALENGTLFEIARLPSRAREFVVFGPSAQAPMECLGSLGASLVLTSRIIDAHALVESMLGGFSVARAPGVSEGYLVRVGTRTD